MARINNEVITIITPIANDKLGFKFQILFPLLIIYNPIVNNAIPPILKQCIRKIKINEISPRKYSPSTAIIADIEFADEDSFLLYTREKSISKLKGIDIYTYYLYNK